LTCALTEARASAIDSGESWADLYRSRAALRLEWKNDDRVDNLLWRDGRLAVSQSLNVCKALHDLQFTPRRLLELRRGTAVINDYFESEQAGDRHVE
jgi:hypothetical protein